MDSSYFKSAIVIYTLHELATAYELTYWVKVAFDEIISWSIDRIKREFPEIVKEVTQDITPEDCLVDGLFVMAIQVYRDRHDCTLQEAKDAVTELRTKLRGETHGAEREV